jgi:DNA-binding transcriptional LysR family regulator
MASRPLEPVPTYEPAPEPSWDDLRIFLAVVAHGSMNGAGRALGQSQPTVARRMRALEETLGVTLFQRTPNRLELTEAGRAVLEAASPMAEAAGAVPKVASAYRPDPAAPVRITATMSATLFLSHHAVDLALATQPTEIAYLPTRRRLDLAGGEADIALRMRQLPDEEDLVGHKLGRMAFAIYARTSEPSAIIVFRSRPRPGLRSARGDDRGRVSRHAPAKPDPAAGDTGRVRPDRAVPAPAAGSARTRARDQDRLRLKRR